MVAEFVHEQVVGPFVAGRGGAELAEDATAAIGFVIHQNLDELVRRVLGDPAQRRVIEREHIALAAEDVVARAQCGSVVHAGRGTRDARFGGRYRQRPDVEIVRALLEGRHREQVLRQAPRIRLELLHLALRVAVAQDQQIDFLRRRPAHPDRNRRRGRRRLFSDDVRRIGIDLDAPGHGECVALVALQDAHAHRAVGLREAHRFLEATADLVGLLRRAPFAKNGGKVARIDQVTRLRVRHLDPVLAAVRVVQAARGVTGPGQRLDQDLFEGVAVGERVAAVGVVDAHGGRLRCNGDASRGSQGRNVKANQESRQFILQLQRLSHCNSPMLE
jgi:hypothetical protein